MQISSHDLFQLVSQNRICVLYHVEYSEKYPAIKNELTWSVSQGHWHRTKYICFLCSKSLNATFSNVNSVLINISKWLITPMSCSYLQLKLLKVHIKRTWLQKSSYRVAEWNIKGNPLKKSRYLQNQNLKEHI